MIETPEQPCSTLHRAATASSLARQSIMPIIKRNAPTNVTSIVRLINTILTTGKTYQLAYRAAREPPSTFSRATPCLPPTNESPPELPSGATRNFAFSNPTASRKLPGWAAWRPRANPAGPIWWASAPNLKQGKRRPGSSMSPAMTSMYSSAPCGPIPWPNAAAPDFKTCAVSLSSTPSMAFLVPKRRPCGS